MGTLCIAVEGIVRKSLERRKHVVGHAARLVSPELWVCQAKSLIFEDYYHIVVRVRQKSEVTFLHQWVVILDCAILNVAGDPLAPICITLWMA